MGELKITNGFYKSSSLPISNQECINLFPVINPVKSLSKENLLGSPGVSLLTSTGKIEQVNRGSGILNGIPYFINGTSLYRLDKTTVANIDSFSTTDLGTIAGTKRVSIASNSSNQLMILVPGENGYIYNDTTGGLEIISDLDFKANGNPTFVVYIDGYFVCTTDDDKIINSSLQDGLTWSALDFASVESDPDAVVAPIVTNNQLYVLGATTTEGFQNIGGQGFPFQRNNVFLDKGCSAPYSLIKANQSYFFIGKGADERIAIWQFENTNFQKISTLAIDNLIEKFTDTEIRDSFALYYGDAGQFFIIFVLPNTAISYDLVTGKWTERKSTIDEEVTRWRPNSLVTAYERIIVGDSVDGRIGVVSLDDYFEYGDNIVRTFSLEPFANMDGFSIPYLELTMESGVGNNDCGDPQVSMSISRDGKNFSGEKIRGIGKKGEFTRRIVWRRLGRVKRFSILKFRISDPVKAVFAKLEAK